MAFIIIAFVIAPVFGVVASNRSVRYCTPSREHFPSLVAAADSNFEAQLQVSIERIVQTKDHLEFRNCSKGNTIDNF